MSTPEAMRQLEVRVTDPLRRLAQAIDQAGRLSLALLVDDQHRLLAALTDGDLRRGLLAGLGLDSPILNLLPIKAFMPNPQAVTVPVGTSTADMLALMQERHIRQLPVLDDEGRVQDVALLQDLLPNSPPALEALIMAGGFGTRLRPLTDLTPKPLLPVAGRPVLEWILDQLRCAGIEKVCISTHYLGEQIREHFGSGERFGVQVGYVNETEPLGTGGALGLMDRPAHPILVINGDVMTKVDVRKMLDFHQDHGADLTMAVNMHEFQVPYGVVHGDGARVSSMEEKPKLRMLVNAGIYLVEPAVLDRLPKGEPFHMTQVVDWLLTAKRPVVSFPIREYWMDIGQHQDYQKAQRDQLDDGPPAP